MKSRIQYVYTPRNWRRRAIVYRTLIVITSPIIALLMAFSYIGQFAEFLLDKGDDVLERITEIIVFKEIKRRW